MQKYIQQPYQEKVRMGAKKENLRFMLILLLIKFISFFLRSSKQFVISTGASFLLPLGIFQFVTQAQ